MKITPILNYPKNNTYKNSNAANPLTQHKDFSNIAFKANKTSLIQRLFKSFKQEKLSPEQAINYFKTEKLDWFKFTMGNHNVPELFFRKSCGNGIELNNIGKVNFILKFWNDGKIKQRPIPKDDYFRIFNETRKFANNKILNEKLDSNPVTVIKELATDLASGKIKANNLWDSTIYLISEKKLDIYIKEIKPITENEKPVYLLSVPLSQDNPNDNKFLITEEDVVYKNIKKLFEVNDTMVSKNDVLSQVRFFDNKTIKIDKMIESTTAQINELKARKRNLTTACNKNKLDKEEYLKTNSAALQEKQDAFQKTADDLLKEMDD